MADDPPVAGESVLIDGRAAGSMYQTTTPADCYAFRTPNNTCQDHSISNRPQARPGSTGQDATAKASGPPCTDMSSFRPFVELDHVLRRLSSADVVWCIRKRKQSFTGRYPLECNRWAMALSQVRTPSLKSQWSRGVRITHPTSKLLENWEFTRASTVNLGRRLAQLIACI